MRDVKLDKFFEVVKYVGEFNGNKFQGKISYHFFPKDVMLYTLFSHFQVYKFLLNKESNSHIDLDLYYSDFNETFENAILDEQGIVDLYLRIEEQKKYIRNVNIKCFIVYRENWNIYDSEKFKKAKNKVLFFKKILKNIHNDK